MHSWPMIGKASTPAAILTKRLPVFKYLNSDSTYVPLSYFLCTVAQPAAHLKSVIRVMSSNPIGKLG